LKNGSISKLNFIGQKYSGLAMSLNVGKCVFNIKKLDIRNFSLDFTLRK